MRLSRQPCTGRGAICPETAHAVIGRHAGNNAVKGYGATVILIGDSYSDAAEHATKLATESGAERAITGERREALYAVTIPERPGSLKHFCDSFVGDRNITEFNYRLMSGEQAHIFVGIAVHSSTEADDEAFYAYLKNLKYSFIEETQNPAYRLFL